MADPRNPERYGECWHQYKIDAYATDMEPLKPFVVFSGGWAWHLLSPPGHAERKHAHDHKDVDIHCPKEAVGTVMGLLSVLGYKKVNTKYDRLPSAEDFRRYERVVDDKKHPEYRLTIDFFVGDYPTLELPDGSKVVRPDVLLTFYGEIHSSDKAWAVLAATKLFENGETPENFIHRGDLLACPDLDVYICTKCGWTGQFVDDKPAVGPNPIHPGCNYMAHRMGKPSFRPMSDLPGILAKLRG